MGKRTVNTVIILILAALALILVNEGRASWHLVLRENFNRDPRRNVWPWRTPGDPYYDQAWAGWHHNPANWPTAEPNYSNASWGLQDEIFNTQVTPDAEHQASIWCAYATARGPNAPQWPDEDDYWDGMNAWAWWGPFNLTDAESAYLSFWIFISARSQLSQDSCSAVMLNGPNSLTSNGIAFRRGCGFGRTFPAHLEDWQMHMFYAESLRINGQDSSILGAEECYIAFVWHSNGSHHPGPGAFIDDVQVAWDDGLFDLRPSEMKYGYSVGEDSIAWSSIPPTLYQEACFKLAYKVEGSEEYTPSFTIECYIDDELFYSQDVDRQQGNPDTTYFSITDEFWTADSGDYLVRWEVDAPADDGGEIEESNEDNNIHFALIEVEWDPPPQFEILTPADSFCVSLNEAYPIRWTVTDSNDTDQYFDVFLFASPDSSGWGNDRLIVYEEPWRLIKIEVGAEEGEHTSLFAPSELADSIDYKLYIAGVATDRNPVNNTFDIAPGFIFVVHDDDVRDVSSSEVLDYGLEPAYPNPFNRMVSVAYTLPVSGDILFTAYDLAGRRVATLAEGVKSAGRHIHAWQPGSLPGGVYLLRFEAGGRTFLQKAIYMP